MRSQLHQDLGDFSLHKIQRFKQYRFSQINIDSIFKFTFNQIIKPNIISKLRINLFVEMQLVVK